MFIEPQGIKMLHTEHRRRLRHSLTRSRRPRSHAVRVALASTLTAWARRLAPELSPPAAVRPVLTDG